LLAKDDAVRHMRVKSRRERSRGLRDITLHNFQLEQSTPFSLQYRQRYGNSHAPQSPKTFNHAVILFKTKFKGNAILNCPEASFYEFTEGKHTKKRGSRAGKFWTKILRKQWESMQPEVGSRWND